MAERDSDAAAEKLQASMDAAGTPFRARLRPLRSPAPVKREAVTG